jgi:NAD-dependent SIR2 family protein deacetylase
MLLRNYTSNVDGLQFRTGLPSDYIIEAHGTLRTFRCLGCASQFTLSDIKGKRKWNSRIKSK